MLSMSDTDLLQMFAREAHHPAVRAAERIAPHLAKSAYQHDKDASFPEDDYAAIHDARLDGLTIPESYDGSMVSHLTRSAVLARLAEASGPTALTLVMHLTCAGFITAIGSEQVKNIILPKVTHGGALLASCTSEPEKTFRGPYRLDTEFIPTRDGWQIVGRKHFSSLTGAAKYYLVNGKLRGATSTKAGFMLAAIPHDKITVTREWNATGMRATASHAIEFDALIPNSLIIGQPGQLLETTEFLNFMLGYAAVGVGLMTAAIRYAREVTFKEHRIMGTRDEQILLEVDARLAGCTVALTKAALAKQAESKDVATLIAMAKYMATEAAPDVTWQCMKLAGGRSILKGPESPLERFHRDSLAGALMPSPNIRIEETDFGRKAPLIVWD